MRGAELIRFGEWLAFLTDRSYCNAKIEQKANDKLSLGTKIGDVALLLIKTHVPEIAALEQNCCFVYLSKQTNDE